MICKTAGAISLSFALVAACVFARPSPARAAESGLDDASYRSLSKQMRLAVDLFERGEDLQAMDRFMEVMMKGVPHERPMANDYLNLITQRMAIGTRVPETAPRGPGVTTIEREEGAGRKGDSPARPERRSPAHLQEDTPRPPQRPESAQRPRESSRITSEDRRLMKKEIDGKLRARSRSLLGALRRWESVTVRMANSRLPRAIGLPRDLVYEEGLRFKTDAGKILDILSELVFSLGATQVVILPEGAILGDAKIMDMRRTMGISSHLLKDGISPARVRVNLLSSQVDVPQDLTNYRGILLVFVYNQPLTLSTENEIGAENGPPLSLGISPEQLDAREGDGVIVEFAVLEPPAGLMSWRFQLLGPDEETGEMVPLQEVKGSAPVFHQIYWNGRHRYFGDPLPPGRYETVLSATDMKNRTRKLRKWIKVEGKEAAAPAPPTASASPAPGASPPPDALPGAEAASRSIVSKTLRPARKAAPKRRPSSKSRARARSTQRSTRATAAKTKPAVRSRTIKAPAASPAATASKPAAAGDAGGEPRAGAVNYQVLFDNNTANISKDGESILGRVSDTMHYYPLDNINLVGYSYTGESDPDKMAVRRAQIVSQLLVERHGMARERIQVDTKTVDYQTAKVEIYIVAGGQ